MVAVAELSFTDRFVRALPGDPRQDNRTRQVMQACYSRVEPTAVKAPELIALVPEVAALLDLDPTPTRELVDVLAGNRVLPGMAPYAACYGGHQFGTWAGQLGDGRAITLAEVQNRAGETWEIQLKGAGLTPYSRHADGRAVLRSSLRELVCSEAMFHLGVPTTRALSLVTTGEPVMRDMLYDGHPAEEPGAVVCRVAPTFLRFGNFEIHSSRDDHATLKKLVDFTLERYFPGRDVAGMFEDIMLRTAWLVAEWMRVGFVHGVMNTDNMSILGLTIDYGPYGWLEPFEPDWTPNTTDAGGRRYRFGNQPAVAHWNIAQLARALAPIAGDLDPLRKTIDRFPQEFSTHYRNTMLRKLGLRDEDGAEQLLEQLAELMIATKPDYTLFFRRLVDPTYDSVRDAFYGDHDRAAIDAWLAEYRTRDRDVAGMRAINPIYVPRNYLVQEVIEATEKGDRKAVLDLLDVLRHPYDEQAGREHFAGKRPEWARSKVGCSMLSCSS
ncbi:MAG TPA: YdiU family protein [Kofleriaceae bacterium]|nr:YdiU family protein [Kofleriaceae bacterium]